MAHFPTEQMTEGLCFPSTISYFGTLTTAQAVGTVDLSKLTEVTYQVQSVVAGASATITAALYGCATSGGTFVAIPGASATLVTADGAKFVLIETDSTSVKNLNLGYKFVQLQVSATVSSAVAVAVVAAGPLQPISGQNSASAKSVNVF